ncbi:uncharacterized protein LOC105355030 [Oryzias latipes]|uniref:uncharacterized protein LOC105355030 n=1 Tax=Oryzias latipes TaxID=8090 RepID=UPI0009DB31A7|nr:uncharacterized protein LOC105355030 [Oryzias latipes]
MTQTIHDLNGQFSHTAAAASQVSTSNLSHLLFRFIHSTRKLPCTTGTVPWRRRDLWRIYVTGTPGSTHQSLWIRGINTSLKSPIAPNPSFSSHPLRPLNSSACQTYLRSFKTRIHRQFVTSNGTTFPRVDAQAVTPSRSSFGLNYLLVELRQTPRISRVIAGPPSHVEPPLILKSRPRHREPLQPRCLPAAPEHPHQQRK